MKYLCIIQARLGSSRFPNKVMQTVGGIPMVKRVWLAAKYAGMSMQYTKYQYKVVVAWPERYPELNQNNVLDRFRKLINEYKPEYVIRLTADCPLLNSQDIYKAILEFEKYPRYYSNHKDGHDVQIFDPWVKQPWDREHVIADFTTISTGLSVNTKEDLERVRRIANGR